MQEHLVISRLKGIIVEKQFPLILLDVSGIGYEVNIPMTCFRKLPNIGTETVIFTHFIICKDVYLLFGFSGRQERTLFRTLIQINGIGVKLALTILSSMSTVQFLRIIEYKDFNALMKLPGIGRKTAERLILDKNKQLKTLYQNLLTKTSDITVAPSCDNIVDNATQDAMIALITLGYKPQEAVLMINKTMRLHNSTNSEKIIREALRTVL